MTTYVALLRGINVGGHNKVAMADLRQLFADLGHADARTHIQSGNVVFTSRLGEARLRSTIEEALATTLGVTAKVAIRSADELASLADRNPYLAPGVDPASLYVGFLVTAPDAKVVRALEPPPEGDTYRVVGREVFLSYPGGYGRTKLTGSVLEKLIGVPLTVRNWRVATKLAELAAA